MNLKEFKKELRKDPKMKAELDRFDLRWELEKIWWSIKYLVWKVTKK